VRTLDSHLERSRRVILAYAEKPGQWPIWLAVHRNHTIEEINNWIVDMAALIGELRLEEDANGST